MEEKIYREKSLERVSSPEQLQDYMRVTNPGIWMILVAVIVLLAGGLVLACTGKLETTIPVKAAAKEGTVTVRIPAIEDKKVEVGMPIRASGQESRIEYVYEDDGGIFTCTAQMQIPDGNYDARIVLESVSPISFLIN